MFERFSNGRCAVLRPAGSICAAWLVLAAGAGQVVAQQAEIDPFSTSKASGADISVSEFLTVDLHVQDEDLANVLQMLSLQSQRNIVVSNTVSATVSANLYDVTFYEALDAILNVNGYGYLERGNFIYVYTLEEISEIERAARKVVAKVIQLDYLNANDAAEFVAPLLSEAGQIKTNGDPDTFSIPEGVPVGDESFALSATLTVFDYPEHVEEIEALLHQLDTRPSQVLVEATILQSSLTEDNAFGVDFSLIGDVSFTDFMSTGGPLSAANALRTGGDGSAGQGFSPADNHGSGIVSSPGRTDGPSTFKLGIVEGDFSLFLRLLDEVSDTQILSNPKVLTLNRQPARVLVGARIGYLNTTSTETSTTQTVEFLDTGTQLAFRPFVSNDGFIRMELNPSVSEGLIREATDVTGAVVTIPDELTQELTTNVIVRDGNTIVLGGLFKESTTLSRRQVPFLGDIPLVGAAFRGHEDSIDRSEIIFMITPTIMNDEVLLEQGLRAESTIEELRAGAREGLLPFSRERMTAQLNVEAERLALAGDSKKALWKVERSLELNPIQPEAIALRRKLLNEPQVWPDESMLEEIITGEVNEKLKDVKPVPSDGKKQSRNMPSEFMLEKTEPTTTTAQNWTDEHSDQMNAENTDGVEGDIETGMTPTEIAEGESFLDLDDWSAIENDPPMTLETTPSNAQADSSSAHVFQDSTVENADDLKLTVTIVPGESSGKANTPLSIDPNDTDLPGEVKTAASTPRPVQSVFPPPVYTEPVEEGDVGAIADAGPFETADDIDNANDSGDVTTADLFHGPVYVESDGARYEGPVRLDPEHPELDPMGHEPENVDFATIGPNIPPQGRTGGFVPALEIVQAPVPTDPVVEEETDEEEPFGPFVDATTAPPGLSSSFPLPFWLDPDWMLVMQEDFDSKPFEMADGDKPIFRGFWEKVREGVSGEPLQPETAITEVVEDPED